jgi:hypothetical protein
MKMGKYDTASERTCRRINGNYPISLGIVFKKSATWGATPSLYCQGEKLGIATGCGYCKTSTLLAGTLRWIFPYNSEQHNDIWTSGGMGVSEVKSRLARYGFHLEEVYWGINEIGYHIKFKPEMMEDRDDD